MWKTFARGRTFGLLHPTHPDPPPGVGRGWSGVCGGTRSCGKLRDGYPDAPGALQRRRCHRLFRRAVASPEALSRAGSGGPTWTPAWGLVVVLGATSSFDFTINGPSVGYPRSKWFQSGGSNRPPHRPPIVSHREPRAAHTVGGVRLAGALPTRRSAATEGHRRCPLCVAGG